MALWGTADLELQDSRGWEGLQKSAETLRASRVSDAPVISSRVYSLSNGQPA